MTFARIQDAAQRLAGIARRTPVMTSRTLNDACNCEVFLKCENFQRMGAFKFRGAYNALSRLDETQKRCGVITYSSGNHAQAVALSGKLLRIPTTIVMPKDAPKVKLQATRAYGAEVVLYDRAEDSREHLAQTIQQERGLALIPPFDHPNIIAGQGTAAMELFEEAAPLDALLVPCGGGGLLGGSAISARWLAPECRVYGVEPEAGNDGKRSFESGVLQRIASPDTIADGARTQSLGQLTFALIRAHVQGMLTVSDDELIQAMRFLWERLKLVVEPTGALGLAALWHGRLSLPGKRVGVILSGGNVDLETACGLFSKVTAP